MAITIPRSRIPCRPQKRTRFDSCPLNKERVAACTIQLKAKLSAGKKAKLKNVGSAALKLGAGQTKTFTVMLNTGGKARLVRIGNLRVSVVIAARDAAGKVKPTNRSITVKGTKVKS